MGRQEKKKEKVSRRAFLGGLRYAPLFVLPSPIRSAVLPSFFPRVSGEDAPSLPLSDERLTPHYPSKSSLEDVLRYVPPGSDEYVTEKYAFEIARRLEQWGQELKSEARSSKELEGMLAPSLRGGSLVPEEQTPLRSGYGIDVVRRKFASEPALGPERFLDEFRGSLATAERIVTGNFQITQMDQTASSPLSVHIEVRYEFVGTQGNTAREQRIGRWVTEWVLDPTGAWQAYRWTATAETVSRARL